MESIFFGGLNCYLSCIINTASFLGVNYHAALSTLWSETDFTYDKKNNRYNTKRLISNLETLGAKTETISLTCQREAEMNLSQIAIGEWVILGIDAFHISFNQFYHTLHCIHYFMAQKESNTLYSYFDPFCDVKDKKIEHKELIPYVFAILKMHKGTTAVLDTSLVTEASEIKRILPNVQIALLDKIDECTSEKKKEAGAIAAYVDTLLNNRYLYSNYLSHDPNTKVTHPLFYEENYFKQWIGVKNGLYKASLVNDNEKLMSELRKSICDLCYKEIDMAEKIVNFT